MAASSRRRTSTEQGAQGPRGAARSVLSDVDDRRARAQPALRRGPVRRAFADRALSLSDSAARELNDAARSPLAVVPPGGAAPAAAGGGSTTPSSTASACSRRVMESATLRLFDAAGAVAGDRSALPGDRPRANVTPAEQLVLDASSRLRPQRSPQPPLARAAGRADQEGRSSRCDHGDPAVLVVKDLLHARRGRSPPRTARGAPARSSGAAAGRRLLARRAAARGARADPRLLRRARHTRLIAKAKNVRSTRAPCHAEWCFVPSGGAPRSE